MDRYVQARLGHRPDVTSRLDSHAARFEGRLQLSGAERRLVPGEYPDHRRRESAELRKRSEAAFARLQRHGPRRSEGVRRQGAGHRSARPRNRRARLGRSGAVSAAEEAALVREAPRMGPPAAADQHVRRGRPRAESHLPLDPRFLSGRRLSLSAHADHHGQRLRRGRRDVPRLDDRSGQRRRETTRAKSTTRRTFFTGRRISPSPASSKAKSTPRRSARFTRSARRFARRTRTRRATWPSSGWSSRRPRSSSSTTTWRSPSDFLKRICRDVLADCQEDMQFFRRARRQDACIERLEERRRARFPPAQLHRSGRHPEGVRQDVRVSRSSGATTCRPSTSGISPRRNSASR